MLKENLEYWSVSLEIIAFFAVTKDLFGNDRLLDWTERLKKLNEENALTIMVRMFRSLWRIVILFMILSAIAISFELFEIHILHAHDFSDWLVDNFRIVCLALLAYAVIVCLSPLYIAALIRLLSYIVKKFPVDGILLVFGVITFVISKGIALYAVHLPHS